MATRTRTDEVKALRKKVLDSVRRIVDDEAEVTVGWLDESAEEEEILVQVTLPDPGNGKTWDQEVTNEIRTGSGRPHTVDSRRAASTAYYAAYHAATGAVARFLFEESWLVGVRWLSHKAIIDAARLVLRLGPSTAPDPGADPDRVRDRAVWSIFQEAGGAKDVDQAEAVKDFFESDRTDDPDTQAFLALTALKA